MIGSRNDGQAKVCRGVALAINDCGGVRATG